MHEPDLGYAQGDGHEDSDQGASADRGDRGDRNRDGGGSPLVEMSGAAKEASLLGASGDQIDDIERLIYGLRARG
jgi:hypothetical protein